ncbi:MAG: hypothetical protein KH365_07200 [Clostridiales bacterium]|nr:hypothetical protein [Clostridiales bacterium]
MQQTSSGYDIEGQALTARYIRVYVTYYRYGTMTPAENWFYLNEITVMGTLHAGETEPIRMADGDLIISPLYGRIENYQGRTSFILAVPTILGAASDENTALATALKNGTYKVVCTVTDENTGAADSFEYMPRDLWQQCHRRFHAVGREQRFRGLPQRRSHCAQGNDRPE